MRFIDAIGMVALIVAITSWQSFYRAGERFGGGMSHDVPSTTAMCYAADFSSLDAARERFAL
jgi:hypothetical protein